MDNKTTSRRLDRARFGSRWRAIGATHDQAFEELCRRYAEGHRAYHNAEHIAECVGWLESLAHLTDRAAELEIAAYFHDAVYEPGAAGNEAASAELFRSLARQADVPPAAIERIAALIRSTEQHRASTGDAALLGDVDLAILGSSPARYRRYVEELRCEFAFVSQEAWQSGRGAFLKGMLGRLAIYHSPLMAQRLEGQARRNMEHELRGLNNESPGAGRACNA